MEQPTIAEMRRVIDDFFQCIDISGSRSAAIVELLDMRRNKTSWVGKEENDFRFNVDEFLDEVSPGWNKPCYGENCGALVAETHSPECILEAAESQGWIDAPEAIAARKQIAARNAGA